MTAPWWAQRRSISAAMRARSAAGSSEGAARVAVSTALPCRSQMTTVRCAGSTCRPMVQRESATVRRRVVGLPGPEIRCPAVSMRPSSSRRRAISETVCRERPLVRTTCDWETPSGAARISCSTSFSL